MLTHIEKARIYINNEFKLPIPITNSDIEIKVSGFMINGVWYNTIFSPTDKFLPFPYTKIVENYYLSTRIDKLERLQKIQNYGSFGHI